MKEYIDEETIKKTISILAERINRDYSKVHFIGLLKGSFIFMADLVRQLNIPVTIDFISVTSYDGNKTTGEIKILKELNDSIYDKDVLIVEDIVDTGVTLRNMIDLLLTKHPKSLEIVTLLDKPSRRKSSIDVKYKGIEIEDKFVVGMGMDYNQMYRNLPYVGVVEKETSNKEAKEDVDFNKFFAKCPNCGSEMVNTYRMPIGAIWCKNCGYRVEHKEIDNSFYDNEFLREQINEINK